MTAPVITTVRAEAERLIGSGGRVLRHSAEMSADVRSRSTASPARLPDGLRLAAVDRGAEEIAASAARATPPDHVDYPTWAAIDRVAYWKALLDGRITGKVMRRASRLLIGPGGAVGGAVIVTERGRTAWWPGGAWIPEIFVIPQLQGHGVGSGMLDFALTACMRLGYDKVGLTVTYGNPARRLYERTGFAVFLETWSIDVSNR